MLLIGAKSNQEDPNEEVFYGDMAIKEIIEITFELKKKALVSCTILSYN